MSWVVPIAFHQDEVYMAISWKKLLSSDVADIAHFELNTSLTWCHQIHWYGFTDYTVIHWL